MSVSDDVCVMMCVCASFRLSVTKKSPKCQGRDDATLKSIAFEWE